MTILELQPHSCYNLSMNIFTSLGIVILIMFILAFLQFIPGLFLLFEHYTYGQLSRKKASKISFFFIFGVCASVALLFLFIYFVLASSHLYNIVNHSILAWIFSGIFIASSLIMFIGYFRRGSGTELFLPRQFVHKYTELASHSLTPVEAFFLGFTSTIPELIFTIPLFIYMTFELSIFEENILPKIILIVAVILSSIVPLLAIQGLFNHHHNLALIQRFRVKNKAFLRWFLGLLYLLIATIIIAFRIIT